MAYIIAATDFSATSHNAVSYAANLAVVQNADLVIIHSFAFPVMISDVPIPASLIDDTQHDAEKRIKQQEKSLAESYPDINIKSAVIYGTIVDTIQEYVAQNGNPWLIVMGNSNTAEDSAWFFSTLKETAHNLNYSVLAVPPEAHYKAVKKVCYGIDLDHEANEKALTRLNDIVLRLHAELHVLNAQKNGFEWENAPTIPDSTKALLEDANPHYHFRYEVETDEAIRDFCTFIEANWLAIQPGKYSFLESLFHKSHTKAMASMVDIPLLILHEGQ